MNKRIHASTWLLTAVIVVASLPLLWNGYAEALVFRPEAVVRGEWWRVVTHPFVHVSGYHLLLDASAFLFLYHLLRRDYPAHAGWALPACGIGSLSGALLASETVATAGLCGLSGIAHGLTALVCLPGLTKPTERPDPVMATVFAILVLKAAWESLAGTVALSSWHLGSVGTAIPACHAGGVLAALLFAVGSGLVPCLSPWRKRSDTAEEAQ
ncbi:MAG: rhombosortase [Kiritimatiellae bacterium]|nr:rhombosortase [Kiritimatiellia bacterium]